MDSHILKVTVFTLLLCTSVSGKIIPKIVNGRNIPDDMGSFEEMHPAQYNTIALVKSDGKIFCTGSLVATNLVVTAKHCLMDKELGSFSVYFGQDANNQDASLLREVESFDVRHPIDWTMTFPSFDIAWVKFKGNLPRPFQPLPILADKRFLRPGLNITQVGYGDHNPSQGEVDAGLKLWGETVLKQFVNDARFFNILVFEGLEGEGSCHGDSGGPAYSFINNQWYILGVTNGFDLVLTPKAMARTNDPDFPYSVDCAQNQSLYSLVSPHATWIEATSGVTILKSNEALEEDRENVKKPSSLIEWCEARDFGSSQWNLLKILLDQKVDRMAQEESELFYRDCQQVSNYLEGLTEVKLEHSKVMEAFLSFGPLELLPNLTSVVLSDFSPEKIDLHSLQNLNLKNLILKNVGLEDLKELSATLSVENLSLEQNPLFGLQGIKKIANLKYLTISSTQVKDLKPLSDIELIGLSAVGLKTPVLLGIEFIPATLENLDLRSTVLSDTTSIAHFTELKTLAMTGENAPLDLSPFNKLQELSLGDYSEGSINFGENLTNLKVLKASQNEIEDISFLANSPSIEEVNLTFNRIRDLKVFKESEFNHLASLNLSVNPILNVSDLAFLENLDILRLFRTPIQRNLVPKNEQNCPTDRGSEALKQFCR